MTPLVAEDIYKAFGPNSVLAGFNLSVREGSLVAIVGPSGSGKTTFLRIAAGFERADKGRLSLGDLVVDGERYVLPEARGIGYVPQEGALFPHLNVRRNIGFGLRRSERTQGRVEELLELVGLAGLERRYPHQLSGGQQQRVALARALAIRPKVVLLDEPFSSLDAGLRASVRAEVGQVLREAGTTAVLVTHDQDEALSFADRVAVLREGRIVQEGSPDEVYRQPTDAGVAGFLGQSNLLEGEIREGTVDCVLGRLAVKGPLPLAPAGSRATVLVRPEQVRIGDSGDSGVTGTVLTREFYGHDAVVTVAVGASGTVLVRIHGSDLPAVGAEIGLSVATPVIAWTVSGAHPR
jgi:iron(III) transport system ATP-binding protein